jgi:hypothetical protein
MIHPAVDVWEASVSTMIILGFCLAVLVVLHFVFLVMLPRTLRRHQVMIGPFIAMFLTLLTWLILPAGWASFMTDPNEPRMIWGFAIFGPIALLSYPGLLTFAWVCRALPLGARWLDYGLPCRAVADSPRLSQNSRRPVD